MMYYSELKANRELDVQVEEAATVADVLAAASARVPELGDLKGLVGEKACLIIRNDNLAKLESPVEDGDKLTVLDTFLGG